MSQLSKEDNERSIGFPQHDKKREKIHSWSSLKFLLASLCMVVLFLCQEPVRLSLQKCLAGAGYGTETTESKNICHQSDPLKPRSDHYQQIRDEVLSNDYRNVTLDHFSQAIRIRTESFDDLWDLKDDKRWDVFYDFAAFLKKTYPEIHQSLNLTTVNTHGLLYTWQGSNTSLKPLLLMAHQDVVPVAPLTEDRWDYPPFEGHYDEDSVWGRGAGDDKNSLIAIMESITILIRNGFSPSRTVILSFGFDEEISGHQGAGHLSTYLQDLYGPDSIAVIVDEEGAGVGDLYGRFMALPALGEKGYLDIKITVDVPGGHSSVPPDHTGIGILSDMIVSLEADPYKPYLAKSNPMHATFLCAAKYAPDMDERLRQFLKRDTESSRAAATEILSKDSRLQYLFRTSQAVDLIEGGVKVNALPEVSSAVVNHRISVESDLGTVKRKLERIARKVAEKYDLKLVAYSGHNSSAEIKSRGVLRLDILTELAPAPSSPTDSLAYQVFSGTIRAVYAKDDPIVAPSLMSGNTDTKFFWNLSKNIYRFTPARSLELFNLHTVNERIGVRSFLEGIIFYSTLILNADEQNL